MGSQKKRILEQFFHRDKADSAVVEQRENGQSRGFGFVTFKTVELSEDALNFIRVPFCFHDTALLPGLVNINVRNWLTVMENLDF